VVAWSRLRGEFSRCDASQPLKLSRGGMHRKRRDDLLDAMLEEQGMNAWETAVVRTLVRDCLAEHFGYLSPAIEKHPSAYRQAFVTNRFPCWTPIELLGCAKSRCAEVV
jgi:hypothetical protein